MSETPSQVLEICAHFGGLQAARTEMMGLFVYDLGPIDEEKVRRKLYQKVFETSLVVDPRPFIQSCFDDATGELGRNPVSIRFSLSMEMSRLTRARLPKPSRESKSSDAKVDMEIFVSLFS